MELQAYDNIGLEYYYLGNIDKAIFYHNRMMEGELEISTPAKEWNLNQLIKERNSRTFKQSKECKTIFENFKEALFFRIPYNFPHENKQQINQYIVIFILL